LTIKIIKFLARKFFVLKFYFATINSFCSTLYEKREGSGSEAGARSVLVTNGSGCGCGRAKNIRILWVRSETLVPNATNYERYPYFIPEKGTALS
jgi:hypothetical protein